MSSNNFYHDASGSKNAYFPNNYGSNSKNAYFPNNFGRKRHAYNRNNNYKSNNRGDWHGKRKSTDKSPASFFHPSMLEDPWKELIEQYEATNSVKLKIVDTSLHLDKTRKNNILKETEAKDANNKQENNEVHAELATNIAKEDEEVAKDANNKKESDEVNAELATNVNVAKEAEDVVKP